MEKATKVYPGIRDLPAHIRQNFRNEFIRFVIKQVGNSQSPWVNPDVDSLQVMYQIVYPIFPGRIQHSDAVHHPVSRLPFVIVLNPDIVTKDDVSTRGPPQPSRFHCHHCRPTILDSRVPQEAAQYSRRTGQVYHATLQITQRSSDHLARVRQG